MNYLEFDHQLMLDEFMGTKAGNYSTLDSLLSVVEKIRTINEQYGFELTHDLSSHTKWCGRITHQDHVWCGGETPYETVLQMIVNFIKQYNKKK